MQHMGIKRNVPAIVGTIVFWLLMCVFVMAAFNILGLEKLSAAMGNVVELHSQGAGGHRRGRGRAAWWPASCGAWWPPAPTALGVSYAEHLANACYYVLALLTFIAAFNQLGIKFDLLDNLILIAFGGLALGFGLSFGLGGRDVMAGILAGYYLRQRLNAGDHVQVAGLEGTVREVGPVATIVETDEDGLINRHTVPNTKMLNEAVR